MSAWASAAPVIGTSSFDGFAAGALMSVVCAMAITTPRRARRPSAARGGAEAAERNGWLCEHVVTAEAVGLGLAPEAAVAEAASAVMIETAGTGLAAAEVAGPEATIDAAETAGTGMDWTGLAGAGLTDESFGAGAERLVGPEEVAAQGLGRSAGGSYGRAAGGHRSRHRRGGPTPFRAPSDGVSPDSASEQSAFAGSVALQSPFPGSAVRSTAFADGVFLRTAFADSVFPRIGFAGGRSRRDAHPDIEFSDAELALVPFACPRRPEARRLPRHAAPSIGLGSRIAGIGSRMTGLFVTRALASGARG
jgi:hypothetical protein